LTSSFPVVIDVEWSHNQLPNRCLIHRTVQDRTTLVYILFVGSGEEHSCMVIEIAPSKESHRSLNPTAIQKILSLAQNLTSFRT
jgi:hypothetical protein